MKEEIIQRLNVTLNALNSISVSGKANLANLSGSMSVIEDVCKMLESVSFVDPEQTDVAE